MKNRKKNELDVDFIGGAGSLTPAEQEAISQYLAELKRKKQHTENVKKGSAAQAGRKVPAAA